MSAIPAGVDTDSQPPMTIPLGHFVVGLGFLLAGATVGTLVPLGVVPGFGTLAHVHLLLVGWVCVTILGAMTQFVPVWSGTELHSRRLATVQLLLVTVGLSGFVVSLSIVELSWLPAFGGVMLLGFWTFVYNVGRTLLRARPFDVTERHFAFALACFLVVTALGVTLAVGYVTPVVAELPFDRVDLRSAHATIAVFGAVLATVLGALYQLGPMFTQSDLVGIDHHLRRIEELGYPIGVFSLGAGRLLDLALLASFGGLLVSAGLFSAGAILARRLWFSSSSWTPMLRRYAVAAGAMVAWAVLAVPSWVTRPLSSSALFGSPGLVHVLSFLVVGIVVLGTLYHVIPFVVWVHRYSDRLGLEPVPAVDDLYDERVATVDLLGLCIGGSILLATETLGLGSVGYAAGGGMATASFVLSAANLLGVIHRHSQYSVVGLLVEATGPIRE